MNRILHGPVEIAVILSERSESKDLHTDLGAKVIVMRRSLDSRWSLGMTVKRNPRRVAGVLSYRRSATSMGVSLGLLKVRWKRMHLTRKA